MRRTNEMEKWFGGEKNSTVCVRGNHENSGSWLVAACMMEGAQVNVTQGIMGFHGAKNEKLARYFLFPFASPRLSC